LEQPTRVARAGARRNPIPTEADATRARPGTRSTGPARTPRDARVRRDPAPTSEPLISAADLEFMQAMQEYKRTSGRMFPTWSEVLEVLQGLGYRKPA
jgi:hypothetical protein